MPRYIFLLLQYTFFAHIYKNSLFYELNRFTNKPQ